MDKHESVEKMYIKNDSLSIRQNLHDKYSVNKYGWHNWVFDQYNFSENIKVIEFGCGTGNTWVNKNDKLPKNVNIILTDISPLMIEKIKGKFDNNEKFSYKIMDIQEIPFEDEYFDVIIANHMLYHVPDLGRALSEVKRALKNDGIFYTTTIGNLHLKELEDVYRIFERFAKFSYSSEITFTLNNGNEILRKNFTEIEKRVYRDSLIVTDVKDLMDYITSYNSISDEIYHEIHKIIKKGIDINGDMKITKDSGMFICKK